MRAVLAKINCLISPVNLLRRRFIRQEFNRLWTLADSLELSLPKEEHFIHKQIRIAQSSRDSLSKFCRSAVFKKTEWFSRHSEYSTGWTVRGSNPLGETRFFSFPKRYDQLLGPSSLLFIGYWGSFLGVKWLTRNLTTHLRLVQRPIVSVTTPLLSL
jgi:hypothetical protein